MKRSILYICLCLILLPCFYTLYVINNANKRIILVKDENGIPVKGAQVFAMTAAWDNGVNITDNNGKTILPYHFIELQQTECIYVKIHGYEFFSLDLPRKWPCEIMLKKK